MYACHRPTSDRSPAHATWATWQEHESPPSTTTHDVRRFGARARGVEISDESFDRSEATRSARLHGVEWREAAPHSNRS